MRNERSARSNPLSGLDRALLSCVDLSVAFGAKRVFDGVTLSISAGQWVAIIGPNGAGKSTLIRCLAGLQSCSGEVVFAGRSIKSLSRAQRALHVALVSQTPVVPSGMTVSDYVLLGRTPHLGLLAVEGPSDLAAAAQALEQLELMAFASRELETLSGGERQRVFLARALAQESPVLLLDEPTTSLDIGHAQETLELIDRLRHERGLSVLTTMHDLTLAGHYADRLIMLDAGAIVASGSAADVLTEDLIARHYGASVRVIDSPDGPVVIPRPRASPRI